MNLGHNNKLVLGNYSMNVVNTTLIFVIKLIFILFWTWILNLICKDGYEVITYCKAQGYGTKSGVSPNSFGVANCGNVPKDAASLGFCVVGYSPIYDQFDDSLLEFSERNGYCVW